MYSNGWWDDDDDDDGLDAFGRKESLLNQGTPTAFS
jgi:hypothetical protein